MFGRSIKFRKYYLKILIFFILLSVIITMALFFIVQKVYTANTLKWITGISEEMLAKSSYHSEFTLDISMALIMQLNNNRDVIQYLNLNKNDVSDKYRVDTELSRIKSSYPFVHSIYLYNKAIDNILGTRISPQTTIDFEDNELIKIIQGDFTGNYLVIPRIMKYSQSGVKENVITIIFAEHDYVNNNSIRNAIIVNVYESSFRNAIKLNFMMEENTVFAINPEGTVISHNDSNEFIKNYLSFDYIKDILNENTTNGNMTCTIEGREYFSVYVKNDKLKWIFVSMLLMDNVMKIPEKANQQIIIICFAIFMVSLLLSILLSKHLYKPIKNFLENIDKENIQIDRPAFNDEIKYITKVYDEASRNVKKLYAQNQSNRNHLKEEFLRTILLYETSNEEITAQMNQYDISLQDSTYQVILLKLDNFKSIYEKYNTLYKIAVRNIYCELSDETTSYFIPMWEGEFAIVLHGEQSKSYLDVLAKIQEKVKKTFGQSISIAISDPVHHPVEIHKSYLSSKEIMKYKLLYGSGQILLPHIINEKAGQDFEYPSEMEKAIIIALKSGSPVNFKNEIKELINLSMSFNYQQFHYVVVQVAISCTRYLNGIFQESQDHSFDNYGDIYAFFNEAESIDEIEKWFAELYEKYQIQLHNVYENKNAKNKELIDQLTCYIQSNYSNPDLSLDFLAEKAGLTPNYVSKLFKEINNANITDFIMELRFKHAKLLLKDTELNVNEVAVRSGYINLNYFYYAFKKFVGVTPANYRTISRNKGVK